MITLARVLLISMLFVGVSLQAALALNVAQHTSVEQCHNDGHDKHSGSHCTACCAAAAIGSVIGPLPVRVCAGVIATYSLTLGGNPPGGIDRPPRFS